MANIKISELPSASSVAVTDQMELNQSGTSRRATVTQLKEALGPASSTDNAAARYDGTAGKLQNSGVTIDDSDNVVVPGDLAVNGGDLTTSATTFNLLNATATTVNFAGGASTALNIGHASGTITLGGAGGITKDGSGLVGINQASPSARLEAAESAARTCFLASSSAGGNQVVHIISATDSFTTNNILADSYAAAGTGFNFLHCRSDSNGTPDTEFLLRGDGQGFQDAGTAWSTPADYAEFMESLDGKEIPVGKSVVLDGHWEEITLAEYEARIDAFIAARQAQDPTDVPTRERVKQHFAIGMFRNGEWCKPVGKIRRARWSDAPEDVIGVIRPRSGSGSVVANAGDLRWHGKYLKDEDGDYILEDYKVFDWDEVIPAVTETVKVQQKVKRQVEQRYTEMVNGVAVLKTRTVERDEPVFTEHPVMDADGRAVMVGDKPLIHREPVMVDEVRVVEREKTIHNNKADYKLPQDLTVSVETRDGGEEIGKYEVGIVMRDGVKAAEAKVTICKKRKLNPEFDPAQKFKPRRERPEWNLVGMVGQVPIEKGQQVNPRWRKMVDLSETKEQWFIR